MNEDYRDVERRSLNNSRDSLVERLDPALGEASSGIGVLLSELVRRTLRGGVVKIEEEMHDFVQEKVDLVVESRMPQFQDAATQTAERKAEAIARQEVQVVEQQVRDASERLSQELVQTQRQVEASKAHELRALMQQLIVRNEHLEARLAELEKPRGLRAFFGRLFGSKKRTVNRAASVQEPAPDTVEA